MPMVVCRNKQELGCRAARTGADLIRQALSLRGQANIIVATGASQFEMLTALVAEPDIRWDHVTVFHLDEYIGMPIVHPASFRKYLWERFVSRLPLPVAAFYYLNCEQDAFGECRRVGEAIARHPVDVAFIGIGENGHIAFNDPPADFNTEEPYIIVPLDEACRKQQLGEGWFAALADVPTRAVSMSCRQIMKSRAIVCTVPDKRKAKAVQMCMEGPVTPLAPSSILQQHPQCWVMLDPDSASLLTRK